VKTVKKYYLQVYHHSLSTGPEGEWVDISSLEIHPETAERLADLGIVEIRENHIQSCQATRVRKLMRLRYSLGVNVHAAAIIMDLLERIEKLQDEIERLNG